MDDELRVAVQENVSASRLEALGLARGMRLLKEDGIRLVRDGLHHPRGGAPGSERLSTKVRLSGDPRGCKHPPLCPGGRVSST